MLLGCFEFSHVLSGLLGGYRCPISALKSSRCGLLKRAPIGDVIKRQANTKRRFRKSRGCFASIRVSRAGGALRKPGSVYGAIRVSRTLKMFVAVLVYIDVVCHVFTRHKIAENNSFRGMFEQVVCHSSENNRAQSLVQTLWEKAGGREGQTV